MKRILALAVMAGIMVGAGGVLWVLKAEDSDDKAAPLAVTAPQEDNNHAGHSHPAPAVQPQANDPHAGHDHAAPAGLPPVTNPDFAKVQDGDIVFGDRNAKVVVTEYASLSCSHCADFYMKVFPELEKKYIDTGKIAFVYRDFPLNAPALKGAMLVRCVPEGKVKPTLGTLFRTQNKWAYNKEFELNLQQIALLMGVDKPSFEKCMADKALEDRMLKSRVDGNKELGVTGTPSLFVNGERVIRPDVEGLTQAIDAALAQ